MRAFRSTGLDAITVAELVPKGSRRRQFKRQAVARGLMMLVESADNDAGECRGRREGENCEFPLSIP